MIKSAQKRNLVLPSKGFTLVELLVVIAIIAILAAVVMIIIRPGELMSRGRDAQRLSDLSTLKTAIDLAFQEATGSATTILCTGGTVGTACTGDSNPGSVANRKKDGTGWMKVNLDGQSATVPTLPVDPVNDATYHYTYSTNAALDEWEINAVLESEQQKGKMTTDGGNNDSAYEIGTDMAIVN